MRRIQICLVLFLACQFALADAGKKPAAKETKAVTLPAAKVVLPAAKDASPEAKDVSPAAKDVSPEAKDVSPVGETTVAATPLPTVPDRKPYLLREGDEIDVSVWQEDNLHKALKVLPDGSISFPLVGRVVVAGLGVEDVDRVLAAKLKAYLSDPVVNIVVTGINGSRVYVIGNVIKPGPVVLDVPMNAMQVLGMAGGLGRFANENGIKVLRASSAGVDALPVHYSDLMKGKELFTNIQLRAGDTLLVP